MRTVRGTCSVLIALALSAAPVATAGQSSDADADTTPAYSTATERQTDMWGVPGTPTERFDWGIRRTFGFSVETDSTDPRLSGDMDVVFTLDEARDSQAGRGTGVARLTNDGGSWIGPLYVVTYPDGSEFRYAIMEGRGSYEGLTSTMTNFIGAGESGQPQLIIWAGDPPPVPDAELLPE